MSDDDVYMAKLAEQAERYEEMVEYMKKVSLAATDDRRRPRSVNTFFATVPNNPIARCIASTRPASRSDAASSVIIFKISQKKNVRRRLDRVASRAFPDVDRSRGDA